MKQKVINENTIRNIVSECLKKILNEDAGYTYTPAGPNPSIDKYTLDFIKNKFTKKGKIVINIGDLDDFSKSEGEIDMGNGKTLFLEYTVKGTVHQYCDPGDYFNAPSYGPVEWNADVTLEDVYIWDDVDSEEYCVSPELFNLIENSICIDDEDTAIDLLDDGDDFDEEDGDYGYESRREMNL